MSLLQRSYHGYSVGRWLRFLLYTHHLHPRQSARRFRERLGKGTDAIDIGCLDFDYIFAHFVGAGFTSTAIFVLYAFGAKVARKEIFVNGETVLPSVGAGVFV